MAVHEAEAGRGRIALRVNHDGARAVVVAGEFDPAKGEVVRARLNQFQCRDVRAAG